MLGCELAWTCAGLMQAATAAESCHAQKIPFHSGPPGPLAPVGVLQKEVSWDAFNLSMAFLATLFIALTKVT